MGCLSPIQATFPRHRGYLQRLVPWTSVAEEAGWQWAAPTLSEPAIEDLRGRAGLSETGPVGRCPGHSGWTLLYLAMLEPGSQCLLCLSQQSNLTLLVAELSNAGDCCVNPAKHSSSCPSGESWMLFLPEVNPKERSISLKKKKKDFFSTPK